jgi:hypothetical protein
VTSLFLANRLALLQTGTAYTALPLKLTIILKRCRLVKVNENRIVEEGA